MKPLISLVIPVFNREDTIAPLLKSVFDCDLPFPIEIIIINSGSTDRTKDIISDFGDKRITIVDIKKEDFNHGITRNLGVQKSLGEYIYYFSGDALIISKDIFTRTHHHFDSYPSCAIAFVRQIPYPQTPFIQKMEATVYFDELNIFVNDQGLLIQDLERPFIPFTDKNKMLWYFNSDVAACYRRSFLTKYPFPNTEYGGEDVFAAQTAFENGYIKIYDSRTIIQHSHNYTLREYISREKVEVNLVTNKLKLPKKNRFIHKFLYISKLWHINPVMSLIYMFELFVYYIIKLGIKIKLI